MVTDLSYQLTHAQTHTPERLFILRDYGPYKVLPAYHHPPPLFPGQPFHIDLAPAAPVSACRVQSRLGTPDHTFSGHWLTLTNPKPAMLMINQPTYSPLIIHLDIPGPNHSPAVHAFTP